MKILKKDIDNLAEKIKDYLVKKKMQEGICIYWNNKRIKDIDMDGNGVIEENMNPLDCFGSANRKHILSMSFEGALYHALNHSPVNTVYDEISSILKPYGLYFEQGDSWNLSVYPFKDEQYKDIQYTDYTGNMSERDLEQEIGMYNIDSTIPELRVIMKSWYDRSKNIGDSGSAVIGAGLHFKYQGGYYFMQACSPWQGSLSWEETMNETIELLKFIGAENIKYDPGRMD